MKVGIQSVRSVFVAAAVAAVLLPTSTVSADFRDWWNVNAPLGGPAGVFGKYTGGCLAGGEALPFDGPGYQVIRPSRGRYFGHPNAIRLVRALAAAARANGWHDLLVGDMAQPRGGPMPSGHQSHQTGLDFDIWFRAAPNHLMNSAERENVDAVSMLEKTHQRINRHWSQREVGLLKTAARMPEVARIFVHPVIKRELCRSVQGDRMWLQKVRPWYGHHSHFHVRLRCPAGNTACVDQDPPPPGDGCDQSLDWWFSAEAQRRLEYVEKGPKPDRRKLTLDDMPEQCRSVLTSG